MAPLEKTRLAYSYNEIDKLLLGEKNYACTNRLIPLPLGVNTDLTILVPAGLHKYKIENPNMEQDLNYALQKISDSKLGIWTNSLFIMIEVHTISKGKPTLNLDLQSLADNLKLKIKQYSKELYEEKIKFGGEDYSDGMLGEIRRLSNITIIKGGPNYFPEELNQKT